MFRTGFEGVETLHGQIESYQGPCTRSISYYLGYKKSETWEPFTEKYVTKSNYKLLRIIIIIDLPSEFQ